MISELQEYYTGWPKHKGVQTVLEYKYLIRLTTQCRPTFPLDLGMDNWIPLRLTL